MGDGTADGSSKGEARVEVDAAELLGAVGDLGDLLHGLVNLGGSCGSHDCD